MKFIKIFYRRVLAFIIKKTFNFWQTFGFHVVFLPMEYPKEWVMKGHKFWNEQYILQAFLAFNDTFEVLWAGSYMHVKHPDALRAAFSSYNNKGWPGSFWIRKVK